jgi:hypothetical protein
MRSTFFFAHDLGAPGRTTDAVRDVALSCFAALSLPALFVAAASARWSARGPVVLLRRLFALRLAAAAIPSVAARLKWRLGKSAELWLFSA